MSSVTKARVAHIIHSTGIGGVETAVDLISRTTGVLDYRVLALDEDTPSAVVPQLAGTGVNSPSSALHILRDLRHRDPEIVVSSLWRSVVLGLLNRFRSPHTPWIIYLHNSRYTNPLDAVAHRLAMLFADRILCDSAAALEALVPAKLHSRAEVVRPDSRLMRMARSRSSETSTEAVPTVPSPGSRRLVYWGRAAGQKRLDRALELVAVLEARRPQRFVLDLICPESDLLRDLLASARSRDLPVNWLGPRDAAEICGIAETASFFVLLSEFEGLAMSVREALALGLVPVVTCVGEIGEYTQDGTNSIHVSNGGTDEREDVTVADLESAAERIIALDADSEQLSAMSEAARAVPGGDFVADFESAVFATLAPKEPKSQSSSAAPMRVTK